MVIDHVVLLTRDADEMAECLRRDLGLGSEPGMFYEKAGTKHHTVPLAPPQYLEFIQIEDRALAAQTETGRLALAVEAAGGGLFHWAVLVDDLEAVSRRLGKPIEDSTTPQSDGTLRGWRAVAGTKSLPAFIDYPKNPGRDGRLAAAYARVGHTCSPGTFSALSIGASETEMNAWLGEHDLPLSFANGRAGIFEARISTAAGEITIT